MSSDLQSDEYFINDFTRREFLKVSSLGAAGLTVVPIGLDLPSDELYNTELKISADYELMLRFLEKDNISTAYIPEILIVIGIMTIVMVTGYINLIIGLK